MNRIESYHGRSILLHPLQIHHKIIGNFYHNFSGVLLTIIVPVTERDHIFIFFGDVKVYLKNSCDSEVYLGMENMQQ